MASRTLSTLALVLAVFTSLGALQARADNDRVRVGGNIIVEREETVGDVVCIGGSVINRGKINGDVVVMGGTLRSEGAVEGDMVVMGGHANIDNRVGGDTVVMGGAIQLGPSAEIMGDSVALGGAIQQDSGSVIHGESHGFSGPWWLFGLSGIGMLAVFALLGAVPFALVAAILAYAIAGRNRVEAVAQAARVSTGQAFGLGFTVVVAVMLLVWLATFMHPITPFVIIAIFIAFLITVSIGFAGASSWVGRRLARNAGPFAVVVIGVVVLQIVALIPVIGWAIFAFVLMVALGSAVLSGWGETPYWLAKRI
jgi:hypothetical protein